MMRRHIALVRFDGSELLRFANYRRLSDFVTRRGRRNPGMDCRLDRGRLDALTGFRQMKVLLTGATGLIGGEIAGRLVGLGHEVVAVSRRREARRLLATETISLDFRSAVLADWLGYLADVDAVVNCVGVLQGNGSDSPEAAHARGPAVLFEACEAAGVRRVIHFSAVGVDRGRAVLLLGEQGSGGRGPAGTRSRLGDPAALRRPWSACLRSERALPRPCDLAAPAEDPGRWTSPGGTARGRRGDRGSPAR